MMIYLRIVMYLLTFLAIIVHFKFFKGLQWPTSHSCIYYHGVASSTSNVLVHSLAVIHNSSTLGKSEEKRQRTMNRLHA
ncbi:unnamed protein product [Amaranthus hypochondriacus]